MAVSIKPISKGGSSPSKPSYEELMAKAVALTKNSPALDTTSVLKDLANAQLAPVAKDKVLHTVHQSTGSGKRPLRQQLAMFEQEAGLSISDPALELARGVRAKHFNDGAHLRRCSDGSYWVYEKTHWKETNGGSLRRMILEEGSKATSHERD